ncbi:MurR/RpiR family transcriptional regulator [Vibrio lamellibrachiae]|uniref:MurR/RpiR family transcriptional regulator n=1 Tax=Vibrio lamellibrachiae TaxID=2910253 RepID=UPI003D0FE95C
MERKDALSLIFERQNEFSDTEKKIASAITRDATYFSITGISQLSEAIGVSAASISRFARKIGFESTKELKFYLAQQSGNGEVASIDERLVTDGFNVLYESISTVLLNNVVTLSGSYISILANFIEQSERLFIFSKDLAFSGVLVDAEYRFAKLNKNITTASHSDLIRVHSHSIRSSDVVICIDIDGQDEDLLNVIMAGKKAQARTVSVCAAMSAITQHADLVIAINSMDLTNDNQTLAYRHLLMAYLDSIEFEIESKRRAMYDALIESTDN